MPRCAVSKPYMWDDEFNDVEAIVRAAGHYVAASDNLRPRVLEAVRMETGEQRSRHCLRTATLFTLLVVLFTSVARQIWDGPQVVTSSLDNPGYEESISPISAMTTRTGDGDWRIIDAFIKLRRQQAQLLRSEI